MIVYFGKDANGHYADDESGHREYLPEALWLEYVRAGEAAGAKRAERMKLSIQMQAKVDKYEGDTLVETVHGEQDTDLL